MTLLLTCAPKISVTVSFDNYYFCIENMILGSLPLGRYICYWAVPFTEPLGHCSTEHRKLEIIVSLVRIPLILFCWDNWKAVDKLN